MTGLKRIRSLSQKGKATSVNYSVDTSVIAPGRSVSVVIKTAMMIRKRKLTQASLKKGSCRKTLVWVRSMKTESPDTSYPPQAVKVLAAVKAPVQSSEGYQLQWKPQLHLWRKFLPNHNILLTTKSIFYVTISQIDQINVLSYLQAKSSSMKSLSPKARFFQLVKLKVNQEGRKKSFHHSSTESRSRTITKKASKQK